MKPSTILTRAADLIEKRGLCRGALARDKNRDQVDALDRRAVSWCPIGAIQRVVFHRDGATPAMEIFNATAALQAEINGCVTPWVDDTRRSAAVVVRMMRKAADRARKQETNQ